MKVSEALHSNRQVLATCIPEESIVAFATRLDSLNIGAMPVVDAHGALVGVISERDIVRAFVKEGATRRTTGSRLHVPRRGHLRPGDEHDRGREAHE